MTILTDELVEKAEKAISAAFHMEYTPGEFWMHAKAALSAVLPDVTAAERERAAKVAEGDTTKKDLVAHMGRAIAAAIRKGD